MNNIKLEDINGLLNFVGCSEDFFEDYAKLGYYSFICSENLDLTTEQGIIVIEESKENCFYVRLNERSFMNSKMALDYHTKCVISPYNFINLLSVSFDINIVLGFVRDVIKDYFEAFLVIEKDKKYICSNVYFSDIISLERITNFPIYVRKEIWDKRKVPYPEVNQRIMENLENNDQKK